MLSEQTVLRQVRYLPMYVKARVNEDLHALSRLLRVLLLMGSVRVATAASFDTCMGLWKH